MKQMLTDLQSAVIQTSNIRSLWRRKENELNNKQGVQLKKTLKNVKQMRLEIERFTMTQEKGKQQQHQKKKTLNSLGFVFWGGGVL